MAIPCCKHISLDLHVLDTVRTRIHSRDSAGSGTPTWTQHSTSTVMLYVYITATARTKLSQLCKSTESFQPQGRGLLAGIRNRLPSFSVTAALAEELRAVIGRRWRGKLWPSCALALHSGPSANYTT